MNPNFYLEPPGPLTGCSATEITSSSATVSCSSANAGGLNLSYIIEVCL